MRIAFLGWGSLIWNPCNLLKSGQWKTDGPCLPIEFARVSKDCRLTLVIHPGATNVQTLWANVADGVNLQQAMESLRDRECTCIGHIGFVSLQDGRYHCNVLPDILPLIKSWGQEKGLDAIVWTDLGSNFEEKTGMEFNERNIIRYLEGLKDDALCKAREYVEKTPEQIRTGIRGIIEKELRWVPHSAPLFFQTVRQVLIPMFYKEAQLGRSIRSINPEFRKKLFSSILELADKADDCILSNRDIRAKIEEISRNTDVTIGQAQKVINVYLKYYCILTQKPVEVIKELDCPLDSQVMSKFRTKRLTKMSLRGLTELGDYVAWQRHLKEIGEGIRLKPDIQTYDGERIRAFLS